MRILRSLSLFIFAWAIPETGSAQLVERSVRPIPRLTLNQPVLVSQNPAGFDRWLNGFMARAAQRGISDKTLTKVRAAIEYLPETIKKDRRQSEFSKALWEYLDTAVSPERIRLGKSAARKRKRLLNRIERTYGVEAEILVAIWGLESSFGTFRGKVHILSSLATLAFEGRRAKFFEEQLIAALVIIEQGHVTPARMKGSWAGGMGHTQFIPTSFLSHAVDFKKDGKRDIWSDDPTDALASAASYLRSVGWTPGQPWGMEVRLPDGFDNGQIGLKNKKSAAAWSKLGVRRMDGKKIPNKGPVAIIMPAGTRGAAFAVFENFSVIKRYNNSDAYAIAIGHLADRIQGGDPIKAGWPRDDRRLTRKEIRQLQRLLIRRGYDTGGTDGKVGPKTRSAVREYQTSQGLPPDGYVSIFILEHIRKN